VKNLETASNRRYNIDKKGVKQVYRINRTNDYVFKRIFGSEEGKEALLDFLNAVFRLPPGKKLVDVKLLDREIDPEHLLDRAARLDVLAEASDGSLINIEVQIANRFDIDRRTLYYWARLYGGQLKSGQRFSELRKTVTINILAFDWFTDERYHHVFCVRDIETGELLDDHLEIHFLELNKVLKREWDPDDPLEAWLMYLNNLEGEGLRVIAEKNPAIKKALTIEEIFRKSDAELRLYELREKALHDEATMVAGARAEGRAEGRIEGLQDSIIWLLQKRFGNGYEARIRQVKDVGTLGELFDALLDAETPKEANETVARILGR
jgi:predicted transposase/invertase (TIGR01784 family)